MKSKTQFLTIIIFITTLSLNAQHSPDKLAIASFVSAFNRFDSTDLEAVFADELFKKITRQQVIQFLRDIKANFGDIDSYYFKKVDERNLSVYILQSGNKLMRFLTKPTEDGRLSRFIIMDVNYNEELSEKHNKSSMRLPFNGTWNVFWGGDDEDNNYHVTNRAQKNAFDFVIRNEQGKTFQGDSTKNENYFAFAKDIFSPCNGKIVELIDGINDNVPGIMNRKKLTGNTLVIKARKGEYVLLAHLKENSIVVKKGQRVRMGQKLALCGNSGNSSEAHLHMHIMDKPSLKDATGVKCFFTHVLLPKRATTNRNYSPLKGEQVANPKL